MNKIKVLLSCFIFSYVLLMSTASEAVEYKLHVIDMPEGRAYSTARKINDNGIVVGVSAMDAGGFNNPEVYYWDGAGAHRTGIYDYYQVAGVNNAGTIVGGACVFSNNTSSTLPTLDSTSPEYGNIFRDINEAGIVVGSSTFDGMQHQRAAYWDSSGVHAIGTATWANAINNNGQIVGIEISYPNIYTGFIWDDGTITKVGVLDGYVGSYAYDINDHGQVVGSSYNADDFGSGHFSKAYLWQNGHTTDLLGWSDRSSSAYGINDSGQVVGYSWTSGGEYSAFIWDAGSVTMLQGLGGNTRAFGINNNGWIVGQSRSIDNKTYAVVWEPVPEPSSLIALMSGVMTLGFVKTRRRVNWVK